MTHKQEKNLCPVTFVDATKDDVLLGRGKHAEQWEGNIFFRATVEQRAEEYRLAFDDSKKRDKIASEVLAKFQTNGSRFLQLQKLRTAADTTNRWFVVSKSSARSKVKQALRDATKPTVSRRALASLRRSWSSSQAQASPRSLMKRHSSSSFPAERSDFIHTQLRTSKSTGELELTSSRNETPVNGMTRCEDLASILIHGDCRSTFRAEERLYRWQPEVFSPSVMELETIGNAESESYRVWYDPNLSSTFQHTNSTNAFNFSESKRLFHGHSLVDLKYQQAQVANQANLFDAPLPLTQFVDYCEPPSQRTTMVASSALFNNFQPQLDVPVSGLFPDSQIMSSQPTSTVAPMPFCKKVPVKCQSTEDVSIRHEANKQEAFGKGQAWLPVCEKSQQTNQNVLLRPPKAVVRSANVPISCCTTGSDHADFNSSIKSKATVFGRPFCEPQETAEDKSQRELDLVGCSEDNLSISSILTAHIECNDWACSLFGSFDGCDFETNNGDA